ncbi:hypothetical protein [Streptomyces jeddahensis]|uniref:hypothetical protein n=1 Tax=Streptomyces jeddahensis TaxID=1716141 RepID=UPI000A3E997D|nr:hypothetical protein [Streptomyces jeddahensis]
MRGPAACRARRPRPARPGRIEYADVVGVRRAAPAATPSRAADRATHNLVDAPPGCPEAVGAEGAAGYGTGL